jgi:single-strand selective monofunctional uracil DNA glycosylase
VNLRSKTVVPGIVALLRAAQHLSATVSRLRFPAPVTHAYNPLDYAWTAHATYLRRFAQPPKRIVFLGMNPGPFGMAQTGVPFGEVAAVRDWLGIETKIGRPAREHPKRPIQGFACPRSEVSGRRLWQLFAARFGTAEKFFAEHLVLNYCPLAFLEAGGRNLTPDKLPMPARGRLFAACDEHLRTTVEILQPEWLIGVGGFAAKRAGDVLAGMPVKVGGMLHPSPASPAANRDWAGQAEAQLRKLGVWRQPRGRESAPSSFHALPFCRRLTSAEV